MGRERERERERDWGKTFFSSILLGASVSRSLGYFASGFLSSVIPRWALVAEPRRCHRGVFVPAHRKNIALSLVSRDTAIPRLVREQRARESRDTGRAREGEVETRKKGQSYFHPEMEMLPRDPQIKPYYIGPICLMQSVVINATRGVTQHLNP